ncbi:MAG: AsmA family protein, partial [Candidatus Abyssobacteria bacterium SURF_17]
MKPLLHLDPSKKKMLKRIATLLAVLVGLWVAGAVALRLLLPSERIKGILAKELSNALDQKVTIEKLTLGFYPDAELVARNIRMVDRTSSREMLSAERIRLDFNLFQLLKKQYTVEGVVVGSPSIALVRAADGQWNIERIIERLKPEKERKEDEKPSAEKVKIGPIHVRNGSISIHDEVSGKSLDIRDIKLTINVQGESVRVNSASVSYPPVEAKLSGSMSRISAPNPSVEAESDIRLLKQGPLGEFRPAAALSAGVPLADITARASGTTAEMNLTCSFSANRLLTKGIANQGNLTGRLKTAEGLLSVGALDTSFGHTTLSFSGVVNDLWHDERAADLKGRGAVDLREALALAGEKLVNNLEPSGMAGTSLPLTATMNRVDVKADFNLTSAGLTIPKVMKKQPGTPGSLMVKAYYLLPDEITIENFALAVGDAKIDGKAQIQPGKEPWIQGSANSSELPLAALDELPSVVFESGTTTLTAEMWQSNSPEKQVSFAGKTT